jgi:UMF1 family MFS transporter
MLFFILAEIGYRSAQVFYNALLPEIAAPDEIAHVSGTGWAVGSAGGVVCLGIVLGLIMVVDSASIVRISLVITAVYFALFAIPIFFWLPERAKEQKLAPGQNYLTVGFSRLVTTFRAVKRFREFIKFIIAFLIYNDGVIMALNFAAILGAVLYGMNQQDLIIFIVIVQTTNVIGAYVFGRVAEKASTKRSLLVALVVMLLAIGAMFVNRTVVGFLAIGAVAGFAMAGLQSLSRSMVGRLAPGGQSAEFFGFFAVAGRSSSFIGPTIYGQLAASLTAVFLARGQSTVMAEQSGLRFALIAIAAFLVIGMVLLLFVNEEKGFAAAEEA